MNVDGQKLELREPVLPAIRKRDKIRVAQVVAHRTCHLDHVMRVLETDV